MSKNIQIPQRLFYALLQYHLLDNQTYSTEIKYGLEQKLDAITKHELYTKYKTAPSKEEQERARQEYLDRQGISADFRW